MAKKVQMSTVELVVAKLEAKGWTVDDIELSNGWVTVWANAYGEKIEGASFKQAQANKWADGVMDMNPVQADEDMSLEEWEQQYGSLSDEDVQAFLMEELVAKGEAQAEREDEQRVQRFVDEEVEPVAEAAPETPEGEDEMGEEVKLCANDCGTIVEKEGDVCPDCAKAFEAVAVKEDALYEQYLSVREPYFEEEPDLAMVFEAMTFRRFLVVRYQTDLPDGTSITRERKLLPSHVYQAKSTEAVCVVAYDTYRKEVRTFRVDKFRACRLGECAPEPKNKGVTLYPAAYEVRRATPMRVQNPANYLATGMWSSRPLPQVLVQ